MFLLPPRDASKVFQAVAEGLQACELPHVPPRGPSIDGGFAHLLLRPRRLLRRGALVGRGAKDHLICVPYLHLLRNISFVRGAKRGV